MKLGISNANAIRSETFDSRDKRASYQRMTNGQIIRLEPFPKYRRRRGFTARQEARAGK
jgi:hypothetical protein